MTRYELYIPGDPQGKGRPKFTKFGRAYTPKRTRDYENQIRNAWYEAGYPELPFQAGIPVVLRVECRFKVPESASTKKKLMMLEERIACCKKPDIDNCIKAASDALNGLAFDDDAQVVYITANKRWSDRGYMRIIVEDYCV